MSKPAGRLGRNYRVMWDQNSGMECYYNPPMTPEKVAQAHVGFFEGAPVDAYVCALGANAGYSVGYPTKVKNMECYFDRLDDPEVKIGDVQHWRHAVNLKTLFDAGIDPLQVVLDECKRIEVDFWGRLSMNDWHHSNEEGEGVNLMGSRFAERAELFIGKDGVDPDWPEFIRETTAVFQDFAHDEVRQLRMDVAAEFCERYDADGFLYDFMRCPGLFKYKEIENNRPLLTGLIRDTRTAFDEIAKKRGRPIGLAVRVPNTISGARNLGCDVPAWIAEDLVDIVIPSTFFHADLEEDISEWADLARNTPVRIIPAFEEGYACGHTGGITRGFYHPPIMLPLTVDMIQAIAARHWKNGADGMYVFNWFSTGHTFDFDNRPALDTMANPLRLKYLNKRYVMMRTDASFPNCLPHPRQIPVKLTEDPVTVTINVADDLKEAGERVKRVQLHVHLSNLRVIDRLEVAVNGQDLACTNPMKPGAYNTKRTAWQNYDLAVDQVTCGDNEVSLRIVGRDSRLARQLPVAVEDIELAIEYDYPDGPWYSPPGFVPRT